MKILFTGGGTGGHFYPIIAVAEQVHTVADNEKLADVKLYFMSDKPYDKKALFQNAITFVPVTAGKLRMYVSLENIIDIFKTGIGVLRALVRLFIIYPDVVFSKGGYAAFPVVCAAWLLRIPVVMHESDSYPGRVSQLTSRIAQRIAVSYPEALQYLSHKERGAWTGQPVRTDIALAAKTGMHEYLNLETHIPTILILGGSQGAHIINEALIELLPVLVKKYQIIHQTGPAHIDEISYRAKVLLEGLSVEEQRRYRPYGFLSPLELKMAAGAAKMVISRAGSTIFEIASWELPSLIIPITNTHGDHQRKNAYTYARQGACIVLEENNISQTVLLQSIEDIMDNPQRWQELHEKTKSFSRPDAAKVLATELLRIGIEHEK